MKKILIMNKFFFLRTDVKKEYSTILTTRTVWQGERYLGDRMFPVQHEKNSILIAEKSIGG